MDSALLAGLRPGVPRAAFVDRLKPETTRSKGWKNGVLAVIEDHEVDEWPKLAAGVRSMRAKLALADRVAPYQLWAPRISRFSFELLPFSQVEDARE